MTYLALLLALALTPTAASVVPAIDETYPPPHDVRRPDRTISGVEKKGPVAAIAYSPDGRSVATGGGDGVVRLWNARTGEDLTGELQKSFDPLRARVTALAFHADGKALVAASADHAVTTFDLTSGKTLARKALPAAGPLALNGGSAAAVAGHRLTVWNSDSGEVTRALPGPAPRPSALVFRPDGRILAAASGKAIQLYSLESGAATLTLDAGAPVRVLAASATHLAAGFADGTVKVWPFEGGEPRPLAGHQGPIDALAFSPKGEQVAAAGRGRLVSVWDVATGTWLCAQQGHTGAVVAVAFSPNGQKMASAGADGTLRHWTVPLPPLAAADLVKLTAAVPARASVAPKKPRKVLVFWRADAILHKGGVPAANKAIELMGKETGAFEAHFSRDYEVLDPKVLAGYDAIVLNSTAHIVIPDEAKKKALLDYVAGGGGVVGIHAAIDMFRSWPEGARVVGATFGGHPWHPDGTWSVKLDQPAHPLLRAFGGKGFKMHDEFYELAEPYRRDDRRVLMSLDLADPAVAAATPLHRQDRDFAVSWIMRYGEGRVFYGMFGHLGEPFQRADVQQFYLDGIQYVLGDLVLSDARNAPPARSGPRERPAPPGTPAPPR
jgi:type 1 glutamine amidotransferase